MAENLRGFQPLDPRKEKPGFWASLGSFRLGANYRAMHGRSAYLVDFHARNRGLFPNLKNRRKAMDRSPDNLVGREEEGRFWLDSHAGDDARQGQSGS